MTVSESAHALDVSRPTVTSWRKRFASDGLAGLEHVPRSGRPPHIDEAEVIASTLVGPPPPARSWSARGLAGHLGVSRTAIGAVWRRWAVSASAPESAVLPISPALGRGRLELLGLWAGPECAAIVLAESMPELSGRAFPVAQEELQTLNTSLSVALSRLRSSDRGSRGHDDLTTLLRELHEHHRDRELHVLTWGDDLAELPGTPERWHRVRPASWVATVSVIALLELRNRTAQARRTYGDLLERLRADHDSGARTGTFIWQRHDERRTETGPARPRAVPRAFDQLALGSFNEKVVIESIRAATTLSRVEIAEQTGLTPQAVSRITRNLLTSGFLTEGAHRSSGKGKPRVPLRLRPDAAHALGIHLDPEVITQVVVDLCGRIVDRRQLPLHARRDPSWCIDQIARMAEEALETSAPEGGAFLGVGVAVPGPIDADAGVIVNPPLFQEWRDVPLRDELADRLGLPVTVEKDATAAAVGERWIGAADRAGDFVYLYLGTGAGSGAFLNGDVYRGTTGNAGELGELCALTMGLLTPDGGPQMVAECAPMSAVVDRALAAGLDLVAAPPEHGTSSPYEQVCIAAAEGDERAVSAVRGVAQVVARGAIGVIDLLDVGSLIIGGPAVLPQVADIYFAEVAAAVNRFPMASGIRKVQVARSLLNDSAAAVGAASGVFHAAFAPRLRTHARTSMSTSMSS
jgi:predicted NBD/HSP70 family sugar kinase